jgi:adenylate cyclase
LSPDSPKSGSNPGKNTEDALKDPFMFGELNPCGGGDPIPLQKQWLVVGRQPSCDITLRFPNVSSRHCELRLMNGYWHVRDLGSRNGIKVNGIRCDAHWLMPGDVISVSKHRFEVNYSPTGEAPPVESEPDPLSIPLLEKAGLSRRGGPDATGFPKADPQRRRDSVQRHALDAGNPRRIDDDDDELDDDKLVWLDK